ncbi:MAG: ribosomal-protein-alanine N-acetyltransferase [Pseudohongiellaceae bacterium]
MKVIITKPEHAAILANYYGVNEAHLLRWSPAVPYGHHTIEAWRRRLEMREQEMKNHCAMHFIGTDTEESHIIGTCSLSNVVRGVFLACHMGYSCAQRYEGQGYMKKIASHAIDYAFNDMNLNRIMANYMPENERSAGLLASLGFEREGLARDYLHINGRWEDHTLTSLLNPKGR